MICIQSHHLAHAKSPTSAKWAKAKIISSIASVYRAPQLNSEILGRYPQGLQLYLYSQDKNGFYTFSFGREIKGTAYGWLQKNDIQFDDPDLNKKFSRSPKSIKKKYPFYYNTIRLGTNFYYYSPRNLQASIEADSTSFIGFGFSGEFQKNISKRIFLLIRISQYSFSQSSPAEVNEFMEYSASGYQGQLGLGISLFQSRKFNFSISALAGASMNSAENSNSVSNSSVSQLISYPILAKTIIEYFFFEHFGSFLELGYQYHQLPSAPFINQSSILIDSPANLNAFLGSIGINCRF